MTSCGVVSLNAAKMPPVCSQRTPSLAENVVPIKIPGLELARRRMTAVGDPNRAAHPETAFGEIQSVARHPADAVKRRPFYEFGGHAALQNKVLDQPSDIVVGKRGAHGGFQAKAPAQAAGNIIFAATLPNLEFAGAPDAAFAGIKPEHDFAERDQVVPAL